MINKISHLGIAVKDLKAASEMYKKLLQSEPSKWNMLKSRRLMLLSLK